MSLRERCVNDQFVYADICEQNVPGLIVYSNFIYPAIDFNRVVSNVLILSNKDLFHQL